jgi:hypothetical protein
MNTPSSPRFPQPQRAPTFFECSQRQRTLYMCTLIYLPHVERNRSSESGVSRGTVISNVPAHPRLELQTQGASILSAYRKQLRSRLHANRGTGRRSHHEHGTRQPSAPLCAQPRDPTSASTTRRTACTPCSRGLAWLVGVAACFSSGFQKIKEPKRWLVFRSF